MSEVLLWVALAFYGLGILLTLPSLIRRRPSLSPLALGSLGLGLLMHGCALGIETARTHHLPLVDVGSALSFYAFLVTGAFFFVYLRYRITALGIFMLPLVFVLTLLSALHPERPFDSTAFRGGWLLVHISSTILGYTGFFLTFVAATMYLIQERELKSKMPRTFYYRLPSLEVCDEIYYRSLLFGLPFLSLGILTGFVWASRTWKGPWVLDPKILASLVTWLIYLVLFSTRTSGMWRGRRAAYVAIFGFAAVMVTFVGISLLSGQHGLMPKLGQLP
ncbi:MAG TPA: cytochrome c biogenesis protein CcsA [Terriglobia bacterium]|nr:cytochrome c biogenesis protein CcsA [Terriglobia bacterium]